MNLTCYARTLRLYLNPTMVSVILGAEIMLVGALFLFHQSPNPFVVTPLLLQVHLASSYLFFYGTKEIFSKWSWRLGLLPNSLGAAVAVHVALSFVLLILLPFGMFALEAPQQLWSWGFFFVSFALGFDFAPRDTRRKRVLPTLIFLVLFTLIFVPIGLVVAVVSESLFTTPSFRLLSAACGAIAILAVALKCRSFAKAKGIIETPLENVSARRQVERKKTIVPIIRTCNGSPHLSFDGESRWKCLLPIFGFSQLFIIISLMHSDETFKLFEYIIFACGIIGVNGTFFHRWVSGMSGLRQQALFPVRRSRILTQYLGSFAVDLLLYNLVMTALVLLLFLFIPIPNALGDLLALLVASLCFLPLIFGSIVLLLSIMRSKNWISEMLLGAPLAMVVAGLAAALYFIKLPSKELVLHGAPLVLLGLGVGALMAWRGYRRLMNSDLG